MAEVLSEQEIRLDYTAQDWVVESGVKCVVCPGCSFTFDAFHVTESTGLYECPVCSEARLVARVAAAEKALADYDRVLEQASLELGPGNKGKLYRESREYQIEELTQDFVEAARAVRRKHRTLRHSPEGDSPEAP